MAICDINGNVVTASVADTSGFGVTEYELFVDDNGSTVRQGVLTYDGRKFYPKNYPDQRVDFVKNYGGGVMLALGDSYTAIGASYFTAFAEKHGLICDNRGVGSSTIAGTTDGTVGFQPFWNRLDTAISEYTTGKTINGTAYGLEDVRFITFMGGANDWSTVDESQGIDRLGDPDSEDKAQLYGACKYIFNRLLSVFPNADIVVILQPSNLAKILEHWKKESIVREMAELHGIPVCDCCFEWYHPSNPTDLATYWADDELHMTADGNKAIFDKLEKVVNNLQFTRN